MYAAVLRCISIAIWQYTMNYRDSENNKVNTSVSVDNNVVVYRTTKDGQEILVVNDFDRVKLDIVTVFSCVNSSLFIYISQIIERVIFCRNKKIAWL